MKAKFCLLIISVISMKAIAQELVMLAADHAEPKHYLVDGKCKGYAVDVGVKILQQAGFSVSLRCLPWARAVADARAGRGIVAPVFSKTPERVKDFLFSNLVFEDEAVLVQSVHKTFEIHKLSDLIGRRVGTTRASRFTPEYNRILPYLKITEDAGPIQRLKMLMARRIDVAVVAGGELSVRYNAAIAGIKMEDLVVFHLPQLTDHNYFALSRSYVGGNDYINRINVTIENMRRSGELDVLVNNARKKYFPENLN